MTHIEALKLALEALESTDKLSYECWMRNYGDKAITAIKEALAQPPVAKPHEQEQDGCPVCGSDVHDRDALDKAEREIDRLTALVAQPEQEPWCMRMNGCETKCEDCPVEVAQPKQEPIEKNMTLACPSYLHDYTSPPQRTWVGLTDDERKEVFRSCESKTPAAFLIAIEKALKEKNT